ncbi:hypothetical protein GCM10022215_28580 [Nocardioides fonticola]|uniref:Ig-like domain-containing protein n=1 Tax=Nocardioides fonticola TaxID=450363 RepID=A0ABP7XN66_9ACTN
MRTPARAASLLPLLLLLTAPASLLTAPSSLAAGTVARTDDGVLTQQVTLSWDGDRRRRVMQRSAVVPGIGTLTLVCRPDSTLVRLRPTDRTAETQLWMAKYESKDDRPVVSVKTARVYRFATATDTGRGGTGPVTHEGLNQQATIEDWQSGYLHGVISQRPARNRAGASMAVPPTTSLELTWWWTGFRHPRDWQSCRMDATLRTDLSQRPQLTWHGDADAAGNDTRTIDLPGLGTMTLACAADPTTTPSLALAPGTEDSSLYVETISGEGLVDDHVDSDDLVRDPVTGLLGPVPLPENGMLRVFATVGGVERAFTVSSYWVRNDAEHPEQDLCEVAVAEVGAQA